MNREIKTTGKTVDEAINRALVELSATIEDVEVEVLEENAGGFLGIGKSATVLVRRVQDLEEEAEEFEAELDREDIEAESNEEVESYAKNQFDSDLQPATVESEEEEEEDSIDETSDESNDSNESEEELSIEEKHAIATKEIRELLEAVLVNFKLDEVNTLTVESDGERIQASIDGEDCGILIGRKGETLRSLQYLCSLVANRTTKSRMHVSLDIGAYKSKRQDNVASLALRTAERAVRSGQAFELTPMSAAERRVVHEALQDYPGITTYSEGDEPNRYVVIDLAFEDEEFTPEEE